MPCLYFWYVLWRSVRSNWIFKFREFFEYWMQRKTLNIRISNLHVWTLTLKKSTWIFFLWKQSWNFSQQQKRNQISDSNQRRGWFIVLKLAEGLGLNSNYYLCDREYLLQQTVTKQKLGKASWIFFSFTIENLHVSLKLSWKKHSL